MPSAHPTPRDSNRPRPARESHGQILDTPDQLLAFIVLLRAILGITMAHPTLSRPARDGIAGILRALINLFEQQLPAEPATIPTQDSQHLGAVVIVVGTGANSRRAADRPHGARAEPAAPPPARRTPHCASANQVRGPPRQPYLRPQRVMARRLHQTYTPVSRCNPHRRLAA